MGCMVECDAFATLDRTNYRWHMKLYQLSHTDTPIHPDAFRPRSQRARPLLGDELQVWPPPRQGPGFGGRGPSRAATGSKPHAAPEGPGPSAGGHGSTSPEPLPPSDTPNGDEPCEEDSEFFEEEAKGGMVFEPDTGAVDLFFSDDEELIPDSLKARRERRLTGLDDEHFTTPRIVSLFPLPPPTHHPPPRSPTCPHTPTTTTSEGMDTCFT